MPVGQGELELAVPVRVVVRMEVLQPRLHLMAAVEQEATFVLLQEFLQLA
jgi:hypothetical protein